MARQINQGFNGMKELQAEMSKLVADIAGKGQKAGLALKEVVRDAAEPIRVDAIKNVRGLDEPTGVLESAVFASRGDPNKPSAIVGVNHKIAPHAIPVEFGHAGPHPAPPHPFMRPAVEANRTKVRPIMADGVRKIVEKYK